MHVAIIDYGSGNLHSAAKAFERAARVVKLTSYHTRLVGNPMEPRAATGVYDAASKTNPVARSNVCPEIHKPAEPSFHAFAFTVPDAKAAPSFVVAGSGEAPEGKGSYGKYVVRPGDTSPAGLREKAQAVLGEMERRMGLLGFTWRDATASQLYTVFDAYAHLADEIVRRGAAEHGVTWHFCRPPVDILDYEMDVRAVAVERVVA